MAATDAKLELSRLGLGCWQFGSAGEADYWGLAFPDELACELVKKSLDAGITYFDTAEDYAKGGSELQLGRALAALPPSDRARCVVGSKILPNNCGDVRKHCEATLARLGLDSIDLYMVHWPISASAMSQYVVKHVGLLTAFAHFVFRSRLQFRWGPHRVWRPRLLHYRSG